MLHGPEWVEPQTEFEVAYVVYDEVGKVYDHRSQRFDTLPGAWEVDLKLMAIIDKGYKKSHEDNEWLEMVLGIVWPWVPTKIIGVYGVLRQRYLEPTTHTKEVNFGF